MNRFQEDFKIVKKYFPFDSDIKNIVFQENWKKILLKLISDKELFYKYNILSRYNYTFLGFGKYELINLERKYFFKINYDYDEEELININYKELINFILNCDINKIKLFSEKLKDLHEQFCETIYLKVGEIIMIIRESNKEVMKEVLRPFVNDLRYLNTVHKYFFSNIFLINELYFISVIKYFDNL